MWCISEVQDAFFLLFNRYSCRNKWISFLIFLKSQFSFEFSRKFFFHRFFDNDDTSSFVLNYHFFISNYSEANTSNAFFPRYNNMKEMRIWCIRGKFEMGTKNTLKKKWNIRYKIDKK